jgi:hypothetical protein
MHVWVIKQGRYQQEYTWLKSAHKTKNSAQAFCKKDGYKYNKRQELYLNDEIRNYREIEKVEYFE